MTTLNSLECNSQTSSEQGSIRYSNTAYAMWVGYNYRKRRRPSWAALHIGATTIASCVTLSAAIGSRVGSCSPVAVLHPVIPAHTLCLMNAIHEETVKSYWRSNKRLKMRMEFHRPTSKTSTAVAVDHVLYRSRNLALMWGQSNTKNSQNDGDQFPFHSQINYDNMLDQFSPWLAPKNISNAKKYNIEVFSDSINHNGHIISATHFEDLNNQDESLEQIRILDGKNFTQHLGQDYTPTSTTLIKNHSSSVYTHEHYEVNYDLEGYDATAFNVVDGDQSDGTSMMGIDNLNEYSNARRSNVFNSDMASTRQNTLTTNGENRRRYVDKAEMQQTRIFRASEYSNVNSSPKKSINDTNVNYSSTNSENAAQLRLRHQGWEEPARRDEANC